jgi:hypothetical protein
MRFIVSSSVNGACVAPVRKSLALSIEDNNGESDEYPNIGFKAGGQGANERLRAGAVRIPEARRAVR